MRSIYSCSALKGFIFLVAVITFGTPTRAETGIRTCDNLESSLSKRGWIGSGAPSFLPEAENVVKTCHAAIAGSSEAQLDLGVALWGNVLFPDNYAEAVRWFKASADQGNMLAVSYLGQAYGRGWGVQRDWEKAARFHEMALDAGVPRSMGSYAEYLLQGIGPVTENKERGRALMLEAAEAGDGYAAYRIGQWAQNNGEPGWKEWFLRSARSGEPLGLYEVAVAHKRGDWMPKDEKRYIDLMTLAAVRGDRGAMERTAAHYRNGSSGLPKNPSLAELWYRKAAERGSEHAKEQLANRAQWDAPLPTSDRDIKAEEVWAGLLFLTLATSILLNMEGGGNGGSNGSDNPYGARDTPARPICGMLTSMESALAGC